MSSRCVFRWVIVVAVVVLCEGWSVTLGQESGERAAVKSAADQKFAPFPNVPACMTGAVERGNPETGPSVILIKGSAGCVVRFASAGRLRCRLVRKRLRAILGSRR